MKATYMQGIKKRSSAEVARMAKKQKTEQLAKTLYKEIFPDSTLGCLSGHSGMFERFVKLAEKLENGDLTGTGIGRV